ncbi:outer membrane lipoprotein-sorting protein [Parvularcula marina]|uniref:outer membrane lipoprotein-sorting protein n=1 Tax=Parvularcula marina TaxID=2292771 RepID=UPI003511DD16
MRNLRNLIASTAIAFALGAPVFAQDAPAVQDIVNKASATAYYQGQDGKAKVKMEIKDEQGRTRSREFTILRTDVGNVDNGDQKFYVLFDLPADVKGTAFMVWKHMEADDDRWLYLPALDLVKRIAASDERTSFVGSHFFYEDVSGRGPAEDTHELVEVTDDYYIVDSTPKNTGAVEFSKFRNYIHKESFIPVKTEYFDAQGNIYRTYTAQAVDVIEGHPTVTKSEMTDTNMGGSTTLTYETVEYDVGLPDDVFSERYLRTPPRRYMR